MAVLPHKEVGRLDVPVDYLLVVHCDPRGNKGCGKGKQEPTSQGLEMRKITSPTVLLALTVFNALDQILEVEPSLVLTERFQGGDFHHGAAKVRGLSCSTMLSRARHEHSSTSTVGKLTLVSPVRTLKQKRNGDY